MSLEQATFWVVLGTLFVSVFVLIATVAYGEISRRMRPVLEVVDVRLMDVDEAEGVREEVLDVVQEWREAEEEGARKRREEEEAAKNPYSAPFFGSAPIDKLLRIRHPFRPDPYDGPLPDKVLRVRIINTGRTAAYEVTGWVHLNPAHLEPLDYFGNGVTDQAHDDEFFKVEVGGDTGSNLLPTSSDVLIYDIAVKVRSSGITRARYEFRARAGKGDEGHRDLTVPPV